MSITRYRLSAYDHLDEDPTGGWVLYDDHVAAVDAAVASTRERAWTLMGQSDADLAGFLLGKREGVQAARDAVAALMGSPSDQATGRFDWVIYEEVLPAIDGLRGDA